MMRSCYMAMALFVLALCEASSFALAQDLNDVNDLSPAEDGHWDDSIDFPDPLRKKVKACWKDSEPRGKGHLPDRESQACPDNQEKSMGI